MWTRHWEQEYNETGVVSVAVVSSRKQRRYYRLRTKWMRRHCEMFGEQIWAVPCKKGNETKPFSGRHRFVIEVFDDGSPDSASGE